MREYDEKEKARLDALPKKNLHKDLVDITDIGGVMHYTYNVVKYSKYFYDDDVTIEDLNIHHANFIAPKNWDRPETEVKMNLNGKQILLSIYELALDIINDEKKLIEKGKEDIEVDLDRASKRIIDWCEEHFHPYKIEHLYDVYKKKLHKNEYRLKEDLRMDGAFRIEDFICDLADIYKTFSYIMALKDLLDGKPDTAFNLNEQAKGTFFECGLEFECYKDKDWNDEALKNDITSEELLELMKRNSEKELVPATIKRFLKNAYKDKEKLLEQATYYFPDLDMHLKYDYKNKRIAITATINSVFDICWYTLARMMTYYGVADEDRSENRLFSGKDWYYDEGTFGTCLCCGRYFIKEGVRQLYCKDEKCYKARKRKNSKDHYNRKTLKQNVDKIKKKTTK